MSLELLSDPALALLKITLFSIELEIPVADIHGSGIMASSNGLQTEQFRLCCGEVAALCGHLHRLNLRIRSPERCLYFRPGGRNFALHATVSVAEMCLVGSDQVKSGQTIPAAIGA